MKNPLQKLLSKPKVVVPVFGIIALVFTIFFFGRLGHPPVVPASLGVSTSEPSLSSDNNISLSFSKAGKVKDVFVKTGDQVTTGEVLATLSVPDIEGAVNQAKGALDLAQAQYASLNVQYANTKKQQDLIVANAYKTLLSAGLEAVSDKQDTNLPIITGNYSCDKEGSYVLKPYASGDSDSGYSINYTGLESGVMSLKYDNSVPLGACGLQIRFSETSPINSIATWTISIPNTKSSVYVANKNAYDLAVNTRDKALSDLNAQVGSNSSGSSVAQAQVNAAEGAYTAALGMLENTIIRAPIDGVVTFLDLDLKVGQSVTQGSPVISISQK